MRSRTDAITTAALIGVAVLASGGTVRAATDNSNSTYSSASSSGGF